MTLAAWQALGIVCGAILAASGVLFLVLRGLRAVWRIANKLTELLEELQDFRSDLKALQDALNRHLDWHDSPGGKPARGPLQPNGPRRAGRRPPLE